METGLELYQQFTVGHMTIASQVKIKISFLKQFLWLKARLMVEDTN